MIPIWAYAAAGSLLAGTIAGWVVRDWKADADALAGVVAIQEAQTKMAGKIDANSGKLETFLASNQAAAIETRTTLREVYRDVQVPADCAVPDSAAVVLEAARSRANAAASGKLGEAVPPASAPAKPVN